MGTGSRNMERARLLLLCAYVAIYLVPLGARPLLIPDEYRYAEIPREMLAGGDWVTPHLAGFRYLEKPILGYWLGAASLAAFGENAFAARLPSALAAGLCALLVSALLRRAGEHDASLLAAGVLLTSGLFFALGTASAIDPLFTLFVTGSLVCAFRACQSESSGRRLDWALVGAASGLAFLTKGFLGIALPVLVLAPFLTWQRGWRTGLRQAWIAPLTALCVGLPWGVAIALREPGFWRSFIWTEHIERFTAQHATHREPFWFFVPVLWVGALPWALLWPAAVKGLRARRAGDPLVRFALCWLVFPCLFLSLSRGKLATYVLPCLPPLAILTALGLRAC
jgi:4-amino-4-deoxy-L-arabinose transferase